MRLPSTCILGLLPLLAACGSPQASLRVWEWEDAACTEAPCWGRVAVTGRQVTYERDGGLLNSGTLTDDGLVALEEALDGLCAELQVEASGDRTVVLLLDCEGESTFQTYDKDQPPAEVEALEETMADVVLALQGCRPRTTTVPDHFCERFGDE